MAQLADLIHPVFISEPLFPEYFRVLALVFKITTASGEFMSKIDLRNKSHLVLITREERVLPIHHQYRVPKSRAGIIEDKAIKNRSARFVSIEPGLILNEPAEETTG